MKSCDRAIVSVPRAHDYASAKRDDTARYGRFFHAMLEAGVYLPPAQFESMFVSLSP